MALPAIGDGEQVGDGNTGETLNVGRSGMTVQIGSATSTLVGFHGTSPCDQAAAITAVGTSVPVAACATFGLTSTQLTALVTAVNSLITAMQEKGLTA